MKKTAWWRFGALVVVLAAAAGVYPAVAEVTIESVAEPQRLSGLGLVEGGLKGKGTIAAFSPTGLG